MKDKRCFAMGKTGRCRALIAKGRPSCGECPFYKPISKNQQDLNAALARLRSLPEEQQADIAEKYYRGTLPKRGVIV